jgi:hypothetical protein
MQFGASDMTERLKNNWFWPLAFILVAIATLLSRALPAQTLEGWEIVVLFDMLVTLPALFALCYRSKLTRGNLVVRILALQCLGIWLATKIVPLETQILLPQLSWIRYVGLGVLVLIELRVMVAMFRIVFKSETQSSDLEKLGMPPVLAKLALLEARFWRWVLGFFTR